MSSTPAEIQQAIDDHRARSLPRLELMWRYYRNTMTLGAGSGRYEVAQRRGLPARLIGRADVSTDDRTASREIVVENDIAWRIHTMVDFMFGKPVRILSTARDDELRDTIERTLDAVLEASGGVALLQDMALLGHVYGHVDLVLRIDEARLAALADSDPNPDPWSVAQTITIEPVEPTRGIPVVSDADWRDLDAYIIHADPAQRSNADEPRRGPLADWLESWRRARRDTQSPAGITEAFDGPTRRLYIDGRLAESEELRFLAGRIPVVHVQNVAQPFRYEGLSEVEPLIPLQDELNTRLSDRASRVTLQSFKMYLVKGMEGVEGVGVGPGQIWSTDNPDASVQAFGGDGANPSEESHIKEIRDALDKTSGVPPLATGVVQGRVGNLSSANALKITLVGLLAKTERKRVTYGRGLAEASRLILTALDAAGVLETDPRDRAVRLEWPDPLPTDVQEETLAAKRKVELGVPQSRVLDELGYQPTDPGIT